MDANRNELLKQLSAVDFMLVDLQLYLNTHPNDRDALAQYNAYAEQSMMLKHTYESMYGPLTSFRSASEYPWQWICNPWPWQYDFNFRL